MISITAAPDRSSNLRTNSEGRALNLVRTVCQLAGAIKFVDDINSEVRAERLDRAVAAHDSSRIYNWLMKMVSYQGISDQVARGYIKKHGSADWRFLTHGLKHSANCSKLRTYWHFEGCRYDKGSQTCAEPEHIDVCPLPRLPLRNGRLNQTAYSLFLFARDIAEGDLVGWIDSQLASATATGGVSIQAARQEALIGPLRNVYGISDKVLTMALSTLLMGVRSTRPDWFEIGAAMITIDSLVHAFLHRTGILQDHGAPHLFGQACYRAGGCAEVVRRLAGSIDAREFNAAFPTNFPRFVQHAIWRYCAADGLNICNGNQINDRYACKDRFCRLGAECSRKPLKSTQVQRFSY